MNFSDSCVTPDDSSSQNMLTVDEAWIIRPDAATCPNKYVSTAGDTNDDDGTISVASSSDSSANKLSALNILLICLSSIFFASSVVLGYFVYKLTPRKAPLNSQMNEIFDTLINPDEKAAFSSDP